MGLLVALRRRHGRSDEKGRWRVARVRLGSGSVDLDRAGRGFRWRQIGLGDHMRQRRDTDIGVLRLASHGSTCRVADGSCRLCVVTGGLARRHGAERRCEFGDHDGPILLLCALQRGDQGHGGRLVEGSHPRQPAHGFIDRRRPTLVVRLGGHTGLISLVLGGGRVTWRRRIRGLRRMFWTFPRHATQIRRRERRRAARRRCGDGQRHHQPRESLPKCDSHEDAGWRYRGGLRAAVGDIGTAPRPRQGQPPSRPWDTGGSGRSGRFATVATHVPAPQSDTRTMPLGARKPPPDTLRRLPQTARPRTARPIP